MAKPVKFLLLLLMLAACAFSVWAAGQTGTYAYYVVACSLALIGIGAVGFPTLRELAAGHLAVRTWWGPAVLSVGLLVLVGVLAARFLALAA